MLTQPALQVGVPRIQAPQKSVVPFSAPLRIRLSRRKRYPYERAYYGGIVEERRAKVLLQQGGPGAGFHAYEFLREAMDCYEKAEAIRPAGNDDALLRWNACARMIMHNKLSARMEEPVELPLE